MNERQPRPYIDWGKPGLRYQRGGVLPLCKDPPPVETSPIQLKFLRRGARSLSRLSEELVPTDQLLDIWGRDGRYGLGEGMHPLEVLRILAEDGAFGNTLLSNDEVMIIVDQSVMKSPDHVKSFAFMWYRGGGTIASKASRLCMHIDDVYLRWRAVLRFLRMSFQDAGMRV